ncbi:phosphatidylcholine-sterol acyltransferase [Anaeramoeba flamelloides]|uniref:Phosphatidylcholine-sterol acyltransferase n=1 Tax=Anaeramoeba flamelloides TaxID=1746091 RepID=A0ABQ8ZAM7_9EUKA|nr:phosphatidylcholine-sterol acyltransferase [Anaeramoeba flamelloides]
MLGSILDMKLDIKIPQPHIYCEKDSDGKFERAWLAPSRYIPEFLDCFMFQFTPTYDPITGWYYNTPGVEVQAHGWGTTSGFDELDPDLPFGSTYLKPLTDSLKNGGYVEGTNLFGAPYDWRFAVNATFIEDMKELVETAYTKSGSQAVVITSHSLGCLVTNYFLSEVSQEWKDKYVYSWIAGSGPWIGSVQAFNGLTQGDNFGMFFVPDSVARVFEQHSDTTFWVLPNPSFWDSDATLVSIPEGDYTIKDLGSLIVNNLKLQNAQIMWDRVIKKVNSLKVPNVDTHLIWSKGINTPIKYKFEKNDMSDDPVMEYSDGDGTINLVSLEYTSSKWKNSGHKLTTQIWNDVKHQETLTTTEAIKYIYTLLTEE